MVESRFIRALCLAGVVFALCASARAQLLDDGSAAAPAPTLHIGSVEVSGDLRVRADAWNWFYQNQRVRYGFGESMLRLDLRQHRRNFDWNIELAQPTLIGLPRDASYRGTDVPLGLGGTYFLANGSGQNTASLYVKQGYVRFRGLLHNGDTLQLGRFTFGEGSEGQAKDATLLWLIHERVAQRLVGDAYWTPASRSFDGIHFSDNLGPRSNVTFLAARPTQGVYRLNGNGELDVNLLYASYTRDLPTRRTASEFRLFSAGYFDNRNVLKVDNRPLAAREADTRSVRIGTYGMHYALVFPVAKLGRWDFLHWSAYQTGSWGMLEHRAWIATAEAGWQPPTFWLLKRLRPWLRAGALSTSADGNPDDGKHATFFQMLPTDRQYARLPFYTLQNVEDYTGQLILRPTQKLWIRSEVHKVKLHGHNDLWYQGSGAYDNATFGFTGLPAEARGGLADFVDGSVDYQPSANFGMTGYMGALSGKATMTAASKGRKAGMAYLEFRYRF